MIMKILECWFRASGDLQAIRYYAKKLKKQDIVDLIDDLEKELRRVEAADGD